MKKVAVLDFSGREQLYAQLYDILFQDIVSRTYSVGDLLPSETELMKQYGISRATVRKAMEMLSNNGLIQKKRGVGSVVISNQSNFTPNRIASYVKKTVSDKVTAKKKLLSASLLPAPHSIASQLDIPEGSEVYCLKRVRRSGGRPFYLESIYCENDYLHVPLDRDFSKESWRTYLANECQLRWRSASQHIYSVTATDEQAALLDLEPGSPLLFIKRVSYDVELKPRELVHTWYDASLYHLEIVLDA